MRCAPRARARRQARAAHGATPVRSAQRQVRCCYCLFLPKFHCELNWIERYWGATKEYLRKHCTYSVPGLRALLPIALSQSMDEVPEDMRDDRELPVSPIFKQRRHPAPTPCPLLLQPLLARASKTRASLCMPHAPVQVGAHLVALHGGVQERRLRR